MMQTQEAPLKSPEQQKAQQAPGTKSFRPDQLWPAIREGKADSEDLKLFESIAGNLSPENAQVIAKDMAAREGCSEAFAQKWIQDKAFRKRVGEICKNFTKHGETMQRLEEAEIFTELMDPGVKNIDTLMGSTNPQEQFKTLQRLSPDERSYIRLQDFRHGLTQILNPNDEKLAREAVRKGFTKAGILYTGAEDDWNRLTEATPEQLQQFMSDPDVQETYKHLNKGKTMDTMHRSVQLYWREGEDGKRIPAMSVEQLASNPETGYVSRLGFSLEKEAAETPGAKDKRVMKDVVIVIDEAFRSNSSGTEFITNNLRNAREYKIDEAEFVANINVGSYVWSRISDVDTKSMSGQLSPESKKRLGPQPWNEKRVRSEVFQDRILPKFEQNLVAAIHSVLSTIENPAEKAAMEQVLINDLLNTKYEALKQKAATGDLTMDELTSLGKGMDVFRFDSEGEIVAANSADAKHSGHLGKAAIMGIPWSARIGMDNKSLFKVVDKLAGGSGFGSFLKRSATKVGLMFKSLF